MNEIFYSVLFGFLGVYLVTFWGIGLASVFYSFISDGEKDFSGFYESEKWLVIPLVGYCDISVDVKCYCGILHPIMLSSLASIIFVVDLNEGLHIGISITLTSISCFVLLIISRGIYRLKTALSKHVGDKTIHR